MFLGVQRILNFCNSDPVFLICKVTSVNINNTHVMAATEREHIMASCFML